MSAVLKLAETNGALPVSAAELVRNPSMMDQFNANLCSQFGHNLQIHKVLWNRPVVTLKRRPVFESFLN